MKTVYATLDLDGSWRFKHTFSEEEWRKIKSELTEEQIRDVLDRMFLWDKLNYKSDLNKVFWKIYQRKLIDAEFYD